MDRRIFSSNFAQHSFHQKNPENFNRKIHFKNIFNVILEIEKKLL